MPHPLHHPSLGLILMSYPHLHIRHARSQAEIESCLIFVLIYSFQYLLNMILILLQVYSTHFARNPVGRVLDLSEAEVSYRTAQRQKQYRCS
jgi:hypothetical protein